MTDLINIIHPVVFKIKDNSLVYGFLEEFEERDKKIVCLVRAALDLGVRILRYDSQPKRTIDWALEAGAFHNCPVYEGILFDKEITGLSLPRNAIPILDERPEEINEEVWKQFSGIVGSHSELKEVIGNPDRSFYIGGYLECCLMSAALYQRRNYTLEEEIFCIEDLCPVYYPEKVKEAKRNFEASNIKVIDFKGAMELLQ